MADVTTAVTGIGLFLAGISTAIQVPAGTALGLTLAGVFALAGLFVNK